MSAPSASRPPTGTPPSGAGRAPRLRVDPIACEAVGLCTHLAPGVVDLDRWGYPIVPARDLDPREAAEARGAVRGCPRRALWLEGDAS